MAVFAVLMEADKLPGEAACVRVRVCNRVKGAKVNFRQNCQVKLTLSIGNLGVRIKNKFRSNRLNTFFRFQEKIQPHSTSPPNYE